VVNNPLFDDAFSSTRAAIMEAWAGLNPSDEKRSEYSQDLHRMLRALDKVKLCLTEHITTGKLAKHTIEGRKNLLGKRVLFDN
jgi:hypothetical protein